MGHVFSGGKVEKYFWFWFFELLKTSFLYNHFQIFFCYFFRIILVSYLGIFFSFFQFWSHFRDCDSNWKLNFRSTTTQSNQSQNDSNTWLDGYNSPLIQDEGNNKMLKLRFDVSQYTPEEIVVKTVDNKLLVSKLKKFYL